VCCKVEISASGQSLVQRSPTECSVPECDLETSKMRRPKRNRVDVPKKKRVMLRLYRSYQEIRT